MDFNYIIEPNTHKKIFLFSEDGSELLNQYISIFKIGGNGNKKLSYTSSKNIQNDNDNKIDKTLGRFSKIVSKEKADSYLQLDFSLNPFQLRRWVIIDQIGTEIVVTLQNHRFGIELPANTFRGMPINTE